MGLPIYQPGFEPFSTRIEHALELLRKHEPSEGYYLAFSGGKDSCVCKELCVMAGVKFDAHYNNVTIDPPELVRFIKEHHPDAWEQRNDPMHGNMFHRIATAPKIPPTRNGRWCCSEYKEGGGEGRTKVVGVRAAESKRRARLWREVTELNGDEIICPVVFWSDGEVWEFIRIRNLPYCSLYDEGQTRIGCVGCPLNPAAQAREFKRWPKYAKKWEKAVKANWEKWHGVPNTKTGEPRYHAKFATAEEFWQWWLTAKGPKEVHCQNGLLFTNSDE